MPDLQITPGQEAAVDKVMIDGNGPALAETLPMPDRIIAQRALDAFETCKTIALGSFAMPLTLVPFWLPNASLPLLQLKLRDPAQPAAIIARLKYDYDGPTALLAIRNPTPLDTRLTAAIAAALWSNLSRLLAAHRRAVPARFALAEHATVFSGDEAPFAASLRQPDAAVFYGGDDGGAVGAPLLVLEVGSGEKAERLAELAGWYMRAGTRLVVGAAVGKEELRVTIWRRGEGRGVVVLTEEGWDGVGWESGVAFELGEVLPGAVVEGVGKAGGSGLLRERVEIGFNEIGMRLREESERQRRGEWGLGEWEN